jgi:hypothetical protein
LRDDYEIDNIESTRLGTGTFVSNCRVIVRSSDNAASDENTNRRAMR